MKSELDVLATIAGMTVTRSPSGAVSIERRFDAVDGRPDIEPVICLELVPHASLERGDVQIIMMVSEAHPKMIVFRAENLKEALLALANQSVLMAMFWALATDVVSSSQDAEIIINHYAHIPSNVSDVRDDLNLTLVELSDLTLPIFNLTRSL